MHGRANTRVGRSRHSPPYVCISSSSTWYVRGMRVASNHVHLNNCQRLEVVTHKKIKISVDLYVTIRLYTTAISVLRSTRSSSTVHYMMNSHHQNPNKASSLHNRLRQATALAPCRQPADEAVGSELPRSSSHPARQRRRRHQAGH